MNIYQSPRGFPTDPDSVPTSEQKQKHAKFNQRRELWRQLPPAVSAKLRDLDRAVSERRAFVEAARAEFDELLKRLEHQEFDVSTLEKKLTPDHPKLACEREKLDDLKAELAASAEARSDRERSEYELFAVAERSESYARDHLTKITAAPPVELRDVDGRHEERVKELRERIEALETPRREIDLAPVPSQECLRRAEAQIDALAASGQVDVSPLVDSGLGFQLPRVDALIARLFKKELLKVVREAIDRAADDERALLPQERRDKLAALDAERLEMERQEEALILDAARYAIAIPRRRDADPRAFLGAIGPAPGRYVV